MRESLALAPEIQEVLDDALKRIDLKGFTLESEAHTELRELILAGFRRLLEERVLDSPEGDPKREEAVGRARTNLVRFIDEWIEFEREQMSRELTAESFSRVHASLCPIYPFD